MAKIAELKKQLQGQETAEKLLQQQKEVCMHRMKCVVTVKIPPGLWELTTRTENYSCKEKQQGESQHVMWLSCDLFCAVGWRDFASTEERVWGYAPTTRRGMYDYLYVYCSILYLIIEAAYIYQ